MLGTKIGLGLGWLRAVAQGYNYNCNNIELGFGFKGIERVVDLN